MSHDRSTVTIKNVAKYLRPHGWTTYFNARGRFEFRAPDGTRFPTGTDDKAELQSNTAHRIARHAGLRSLSEFTEAVRNR